MFASKGVYTIRKGRLKAQKREKIMYIFPRRMIGIIPRGCNGRGKRAKCIHKRSL